MAALIARRLTRERNEIVIIEEDAERCAFLEYTFDIHVVQGSVASVRALREAGLRKAEMLIAVTNVDAVNLMACMAAQVEANVRIKIARLRTPEVELWRSIYEKSAILPQVCLMICAAFIMHLHRNDRFIGLQIPARQEFLAHRPDIGRSTLPLASPSRPHCPADCKPSFAFQHRRLTKQR